MWLLAGPRSPEDTSDLGGVFDLGPASSALPGPQGINILEMISLGHRANLRIFLKCCHAGPASPVQQLNQVGVQLTANWFSGPAAN